MRPSGQRVEAARLPVGADVPGANPAPVPPQGCDPTEQLFAGMFAGLAEAALANAGKTHADLEAALAADEALLAAYLGGLGLQIGEGSLDAFADRAPAAGRGPAGPC